jgi:phosphatidylethanolamine-binding protein (PEBP) family uncharacterized protein
MAIFTLPPRAHSDLLPHNYTFALFAVPLYVLF